MLPVGLRSVRFRPLLGRARPLRSGLGGMAAAASPGSQRWTCNLMIYMDINELNFGDAAAVQPGSYGFRPVFCSPGPQPRSGLRALTKGL
jgi:hypothetical protein